MSKEVEKKTCVHCESTYKLMFDLNETSGFPKFCPFCSSENYDVKDDFEENDE